MPDPKSNDPVAALKALEQSVAQNRADRAAKWQEQNQQAEQASYQDQIVAAMAAKKRRAQQGPPVQALPDMNPGSYADILKQYGG